MPFADTTDPGFRQDVTADLPTPPILKPGDALGAAFRQDNTVVSVIRAMVNSGPFTPDPTHNPIDIVKGTPYEEKYLNRFAGSRSEAETRSIMRGIDGEEADRRILDAAGIGGTMLGMLAGTLDPTMAMPAGVAVKAGRTASFIGRATRMGGAMAAQSATQEAILQGSQDTRSLGESALNVATATILGSLIGGAVLGRVGRAEREAMEKLLERDRLDMDAHAQGRDQPAPAASPAPAAPPLIPDIDTAPLAAAAGAAATDTRQVKQVSFGLDKIPGIAWITEKMGPMQRILGGESVAARRAAVDLAETPRLMEENKEFVPTTAGPSLDREARLAINQTRVAVSDEIDKQFSGYFFGSEDVSVPRARAFGQKLLGQDEGKMAMAEFKQAIGQAMQNGDRHDIPQVQAAAQFIRKTLFEPWKARAIAAGLLPEGVETKTADSYFQRLWNKRAVAADRPAFVDKVTDWLAGDQTKKAAAKERLTYFNAQLNSWEDQITKLEGRFGRAEERAKRLDARAAERSRDDMPKEAGFGGPEPEGRVAELQRRKAEIRAEATDLRDAIDLMEEIGSSSPVLAPVLKRTEAMLERRQMQEKIIGAKHQEAGRGAKRSEKRLAALEEQLDKTATRKDLIEEMMALSEEFRNEVRAKIETEIAAWEGKSVTEAKAALETREKYSQDAVKAGARTADSPRLGGADKAVDRAVKRILKSDRDLSRDELRSRAHEITDRILGSPDGRLPYDMAMGGPEIGPPKSGEPPRSALASREFNIPDETVRDYLEMDVEHVMSAHLRSVVPDVLLAERFGDTRMTEAFRKINDEYQALTDAARSEKRRLALEKERQGAIRDLAAIRDRIRGTFGISAEGPLKNAGRIAQAVKNYNVLSSMGVAALSSLPDMAGSVFRFGMATTFRESWGPFLSYMMRGSDAWKEGARQLRSMGVATESVLANRHHELNDIMDSYKPQSRVERALQWGADHFQFVNLLAPWTDWAKINAGLTAGSEILRATKAAVGGTATRKQVTSLAENGIDRAMAERIAKAFETGGEVRDGVHLPNTADWTDAAARRAFEGAVGRETDIAVVTPGQEKALWLSHPVLSIFGQFKSFTAGATERILIANLQRRDAQVLQGLIFSLGLGMVSYKLNELTGGAPTSDKPADWIKESLSRGNVLGWFEEGNALASKVTSGSVDVYRMLGAKHELSRFQSRSAMDQLLGPTAGKIDSLLKTTTAAARGDWNAGDTKALRRLIAGQNVFYVRGLFNQVEKGINARFGIPEKAPTAGPGGQPVRH